MEDDDFLREEMEHTFKNLGYEVPSVTDFGPETAPEVLELSPDLVILDINLPGTNGYDLCRWLKSRTTIPVLILTGRDSLKDELHGFRLVAKSLGVVVLLPMDLMGAAYPSGATGESSQPFAKEYKTSPIFPNSRSRKSGSDVAIFPMVLIP